VSIINLSSLDIVCLVRNRQFIVIRSWSSICNHYCPGPYIMTAKFHFALWYSTITCPMIASLIPSLAIFVL
jgi:hypothetical protein